MSSSGGQKKTFEKCRPTGRRFFYEGNFQRGGDVTQVVAQTEMRNDEPLAVVPYHVVNMPIVCATRAYHLVDRQIIQERLAHHWKMSLVEVNVSGGGVGDMAHSGLRFRQALDVILAVQDINQGLARDMANQAAN